jgi:hypothetical protein
MENGVLEQSGFPHDFHQVLDARLQEVKDEIVDNVTFLSPPSSCQPHLSNELGQYNR